MKNSMWRLKTNGLPIAGLLFALAFSAGGAQADVVKCADAAGTVVYQDHACGPGSKQVGAALISDVAPQLQAAFGPEALPDPPSKLEQLESECARKTGRSVPPACNEYSQTVTQCVRSAADRSSATCAEFFERDRKAREDLVRTAKVFEEKRIERAVSLCAMGVQTACVEVDCRRAAKETAGDAEVIACARRKGLQVGNGWVANSRWQPTMGGLKPQGSIGIVCLNSGFDPATGRTRSRMHVTVSNDETAAAFNLAGIAERACQGKLQQLASALR